jgi:hypothetical protein
LPVWYLVDESIVKKYPDPKKDPDPSQWLSGLPYIVAGGDWNDGHIYVPWAKSWCFWATSYFPTNSWIANGDRAWLWNFLKYTPHLIATPDPVPNPDPKPDPIPTPTPTPGTGEDTGIVWAAWENSILGGMAQMIDLLTKIEANTRGTK